MWSVRVHGRMCGCGQCVCMGGCVGVVSACAWEEDTWVWSVHVHKRRMCGCGQCVCMGGHVGVVSACAWEDVWVWSVRDGRMRGCGQCVCMGGGLMGVVSACAWEEDSWVWSVCAHGRGIVDLKALYLTI